jgi:diguanylate cyclase (GGDEF)-like protein
LARNAAARRIVVGGALALGAAFVLLWLVGRAVDQSHTEALDVRLLADLQVARTAFDDDVARAARRANDVAHLSRVEVALAANDGQALRALAATHPGTALVAAGGATGGSLPTLGVTRTVPVVSGGHTIGRVVTAAALDSAYVERARAALPTGTRDLLVVTNGGKVAAGPLPAGTEIPSGSAQDVRVDGRRYRALSTQLVRDRPELRVAVLSPHHASFVSAWRLPLAALATLVAFAALALALYVQPRRRERPAHDDASLTRPAQAAEQKEASGLARIGETLAAANDADALLRVILDAAIKATGAAGGRIARPGDPVARVGESGSELLLVPLDTNEPAGSSSLVLYPPPNGFGAGAADVARWLGLQASTAIKNARFQRVGQEQSLTDDLTGLATRRHFTAALHREFTDAERLSAPLAVLLGDLDDFKRVNDRLGHQAGDEVLKAFARTLRRCVRDIDVPARIGGEEFAVLLPQTDAEGARLFAERLRTELRAEPELPDFVTASFGVAAFPEAGSAEDLLIGADTSLHRAKEAGKDRVVVAAPLEKG